MDNIEQRIQHQFDSLVQSVTNGHIIHNLWSRQPGLLPRPYRAPQREQILPAHVQPLLVPMMHTKVSKRTPHLLLLLVPQNLHPHRFGVGGPTRRQKTKQILWRYGNFSATSPRLDKPTVNPDIHVSPTTTKTCNALDPNQTVKAILVLTRTGTQQLLRPCNFKQ